MRSSSRRRPSKKGTTAGAKGKDKQSMPLGIKFLCSDSILLLARRLVAVAVRRGKTTSCHLQSRLWHCFRTQRAVIMQSPHSCIRRQVHDSQGTIALLQGHLLCDSTYRNAAAAPLVDDIFITLSSLGLCVLVAFFSAMNGSNFISDMNNTTRNHFGIPSTKAVARVFEKF